MKWKKKKKSATNDHFHFDCAEKQRSLPIKMRTHFRIPGRNRRPPFSNEGLPFDPYNNFPKKSQRDSYTSVFSVTPSWVVAIKYTNTTPHRIISRSNQKQDQWKAKTLRSKRKPKKKEAHAVSIKLKYSFQIIVSRAKLADWTWLHIPNKLPNKFPTHSTAVSFQRLKISSLTTEHYFIPYTMLLMIAHSDSTGDWAFHGKEIIRT
jgi:hypothetical protein